jgi:hypothetical protein
LGLVIFIDSSHMPIFLNMKMWNETPCLYTFQDENESQNIWDKNFGYKSFATRNEFGCVLLCVIPKSLNLYRFSGVIISYYDILVTNILNYGLIAPIKSKLHFTKGSNAITGLSGPLPLHHIRSNHWHMSHLLSQP